MYRHCLYNKQSELKVLEVDISIGSELTGGPQTKLNVCAGMYGGLPGGHFGGLFRNSRHLHHDYWKQGHYHGLAHGKDEE
jgi:hypothetical protein